MAAVARLVELYCSQGTHDPALQDDVVRAYIDAEAYRLNTFQTVTRLASGARMGAESSLNKVFWSEMDIHMHATALRLLGMSGVAADEWFDPYYFSMAGPIYAGTNEIQRNIIGERVLGLPR